MTSLKKVLNDEIRRRGYVNYEECVKICIEYGAKPSNMERRLRRSESPSVRPVMGVSKRGTPYIKGYEWIKSPEAIKAIKDGDIAYISKKYMKFVPLSFSLPQSRLPKEKEQAQKLI